MRACMLLASQEQDTQHAVIVANDVMTERDPWVRATLYQTCAPSESRRRKVPAPVTCRKWCSALDRKPWLLLTNTATYAHRQEIPSQHASLWIGHLP